MTWSDQRTRIRRFIRDPDGDIWSDSYLLSLLNDEQYDIQNQTSSLENIKVVKIPPRFEFSHIFEWEWNYCHSSSGEVYKAFYWHDSSEKCYSHKWEPDVLSSFDEDTQALGENYSHPWEAWAASQAAEPSPVILPVSFDRMICLYYDRDPLDPVTLRQIQDDDPSWRSRSGQPKYYRQDGKLEKAFYPYPVPTVSDWQDSETSGQDAPDEESGASSSIDVDYNFMVLFKSDPTEISSDSDTLDYPAYLTRYIEYGVISKAYRDNTDGRTDSLADYWEMRKTVGISIMKKFMVSRLEDRDFTLQTSSQPAGVKRKHPRLPDAYPAV